MREVQRLVRRGLVGAALVCVAAFSARFSNVSAADGAAAPAVTTVQASDIPERVSIIGSLGEPLNKVFTVRGKWMDNDDSKGPALLFHVTEIDGSPIRKPVDVEAIAEDSHGSARGAGAGDTWDWKYEWGGKASPPQPNPGDVWEMRGYETGQFVGCSKEVADECGESMKMVARPRYRFQTYFKFIKMRAVK